MRTWGWGSALAKFAKAMALGQHAVKHAGAERTLEQEQLRAIGAQPPHRRRFPGPA